VLLLEQLCSGSQQAFWALLWHTNHTTTLQLALKDHPPAFAYQALVNVSLVRQCVTAASLMVVNFCLSDNVLQLLHTPCRAAGTSTYDPDLGANKCGGVVGAFLAGTLRAQRPLACGGVKHQQVIVEQRTLAPSEMAWKG
jgi:hypothetical protein